MVKAVPGRTQKRKPEVRQTAARLFRAHSYSGTSMDILASELGLNKGTLYHYYRSKSDILLDVILIPLRRLCEIVDSIADDQPLEQQVRSLIIASVEQASEWQDEVAVMFQERAWYPQWLEPEQLATVRKYESRYAERLRSLILRAQRSGEFTAIDPTSVRHAIAGMNGYLTSWYDPDGRLTISQIAENYADLVLNGLVTRAEPPS